MEAAQFAKKFPKVYHLTFQSNLEGIRAHGLMSARALADHHSFALDERAACIDNRRLCNQELNGITLRDQHAAPEKKMRSCLVNITVSEWLSLLNSKIFLFVELDKAVALAERYGHYENILLEIDTLQLLTRYSKRVTLCRINSGAFLYNPRPRGVDSFIPLADYRYKNKRDRPAELTVDCAMTDVLDFATLVTTV